MKALLLGDPFHHKTQDVSAALPAELAIETHRDPVSLYRKACFVLEGKVEPRTYTVTYHRLKLNEAPPAAVVYARDGYLHQPRTRPRCVRCLDERTIKSQHDC